MGRYSENQYTESIIIQGGLLEMKERIDSLIDRARILENELGRPLPLCKELVTFKKHIDLPIEQARFLHEELGRAPRLRQVEKRQKTPA